MNTTTPEIRGNRRRLADEVTQKVIKMPTDYERQMHAIAQHRHWPDSEAFRDAIRRYLFEHRDLIHVLCVDGVCPDRERNGR